MAGLPIHGGAHLTGTEQDFVWFVYGSSLDREAFEAWAAEHGYRVPDFAPAQPARLRDFRLSFDVVSRAWGGPVASLTEAPGDFVEGLALPMPASGRQLCDHKEGAMSGLYRPFPATLEPVAGGVKLPAVAYRASPDRRLAAEAAPAPAFLAALLRGARAAGLSPEWIARLESLAGASPALTRR